ncbi:MAG: hypothetical protein QOJ16_354 [Acidobacteriota bacterium]|jgi:hypothetical protein|nr:hypothetical protein [Acidobacteriota bacterium]
MSAEILYFNGINGETGDYFVPPATLQEIAALARPGVPGTREMEDLRLWRRAKDRRLRRGDAKDLAQAGWGLIFAQEDERAPAVYEALKELLDLRRVEAGRVREHYYKECMGKRGYQPGDTKESFLARFGVGPGPADPERMPYYLLIVGDPAVIPYSFQYQLDVPYAVGRLFFDTPEEYARYARDVVQAEAAEATGRKRRATFFGPQHPGDPATALSANELVVPLVAALDGQVSGWEVRAVLREEATKARLGALLGGSETPDFLFTAGHGLVLSSNNPLQTTHQGALVCQDWPGIKAWKGPLPPEHYFAAEDVLPDARLDGLIAFHFACYSAGSPALADFGAPPGQRTSVTPHPFVSRLPQRLLQAGALAVIGHIERAWECSIQWPGAGRQIQVFEDAVRGLMAGEPVGLAMELFAERYAELSSDLSTALQAPGPADDSVLGRLWTASNDTRNYAVLGDPAVRLAVGTETP